MDRFLVVAVTEVLLSMKSISLWKSKGGITRYFLQKRSTGWLTVTTVAALLCHVGGVGLFRFGGIEEDGVIGVP